MNDDLQQAITLHNQGYLAESERIYRKILLSNPHQADALALLGLLCGERHDYDEALYNIECAIAIDPATPLFRYYLADILREMGKDEKAIQSFNEALIRQPDFAEAHYKLALLLEKQEKFFEAIEHLQSAIQIKSDYGIAWIALSDVARKNGKYELALHAAITATQLLPENLAALIALALAFDFLNQEEKVVAVLQQILKIKPDFLAAWDMLGTTYQNLGQLTQAEMTMRQAINIAGCSITDEDRREVAEEEYAVQHWNLALLELLRGDFTHGFAHYRARFKQAGRQQRLPFPRPIWLGEDLAHKKILIVGEQGFGDVLMLCRYLPLLRAQGAKVVLLVQETLAELLHQSKLADEIISEAPLQQGDFDFQASLCDLPYRLGTTLATIPTNIPYLLLPEADRVTQLSDNIHPKIGVVWAGGRSFANDRRRSIPLTQFTTLFTNKTIQFYNLTRDLCPGDAQILAQYSVIDLSSHLNDFMITARFVAQLDLLITCDTAVAHLAGGMGIPVWLLLPYAPDWRWLTIRNDSPWYPSMRLFRQQQKANWMEVLARVNVAITLLPKK